MILFASNNEVLFIKVLCSWVQRDRFQMSLSEIAEIVEAERQSMTKEILPSDSREKSKHHITQAPVTGFQLH